jgi:hypothetical protein
MKTLSEIVRENVERFNKDILYKASDGTRHNCMSIQDEKDFKELLNTSQIALIEGVIELVRKELTTPICMSDTGVCTDKITYDCINWSLDKMLREQLAIIKEIK